jgi:hypothetical protein
MANMRPLEGVATNVAAFGALVDACLHQDGLVRGTSSAVYVTCAGSGGSAIWPARAVAMPRRRSARKAASLRYRRIAGRRQTRL